MALLRTEAKIKQPFIPPGYPGACEVDYEYVAATLHFGLPADWKHGPDAGLLSTIVDLDLATPDDSSMIIWEMDVIITRPMNPSQASGLVILDLVNRGRSLIGRFTEVNMLTPPRPISTRPGEALDVAGIVLGDGFVHSAGHTVISVGWQGDLKTDLAPEAQFLGARYPILQNVTGPVDFVHVFEDLTTDVINLPYPMANKVVNVKLMDAEPATRSIEAVINGPTSIRVPRPDQIDEPGFNGGSRYLVRYEAKDAYVQGLAFVGLRAIASAVKGDQRSGLQHIRCDKLITLGVSQTGRLQRDFLSSGFSHGELGTSGSPLFDGHFVTIAGSKTSFTNHRWAQPGRSGLMWEDPNVPGGVRGVEGDATGRSYEEILAMGASRAGSKDQMPEIVHVDSNGEFFQAGASLLTTCCGPNGFLEDRQSPTNVHHYFISSTAHFALPSFIPTPPFVTLKPSNLKTGPVGRALLKRFADKLLQGKVLPESRWPSVAKGELIAPLDRDQARETAGMPPLSAILCLPKGQGCLRAYNELPASRLSAGVPLRPVLVPIVDLDGNDLPGIRLPHVAVPSATNLGWNLRPKGWDGGRGRAGIIPHFFGSSLPFAKTRSEREITGDPRLSMEERYAPGEDEVVARRIDVANQLLEEGFLLERDMTKVPYFAI